MNSLKSAVSKALERRLARYVKDFTLDQLNFSVLKGMGELRSVQLEESVLQELLNIPPMFEVQSADADHITFNIQYKRLKQVPTKVHIDSLDMVLREPDVIKPRRAKSRSKRKNKGKGKGEKVSKRKALVQYIIEGLSIEVAELRVRVHVKGAQRGKGRTDPPPHVVATLHNVVLCHTNKNFHQVPLQQIYKESRVGGHRYIHRLIRVEDVTVHLHQEHASGARAHVFKVVSNLPVKVHMTKRQRLLPTPAKVGARVDVFVEFGQFLFNGKHEWLLWMDWVYSMQACWARKAEIKTPTAVAVPRAVHPSLERRDSAPSGLTGSTPTTPTPTEAAADGEERRSGIGFRMMTLIKSKRTKSSTNLTRASASPPALNVAGFDARLDTRASPTPSAATDDDEFSDDEDDDGWDDWDDGASSVGPGVFLDDLDDTPITPVPVEEVDLDDWTKVHSGNMRYQLDNTTYAMHVREWGMRFIPNEHVPATGFALFGSNATLSHRAMNKLERPDGPHASPWGEAVLGVHLPTCVVNELNPSSSRHEKHASMMTHGADAFVDDVDGSPSDTSSGGGGAGGGGGGGGNSPACVELRIHNRSRYDGAPWDGSLPKKVWEINLHGVEMVADMVPWEALLMFLRKDLPKPAKVKSAAERAAMQMHVSAAQDKVYHVTLSRSMLVLPPFPYGAPPPTAGKHPMRANAWQAVSPEGVVQGPSQVALHVDIPDMVVSNNREHTVAMVFQEGLFVTPTTEFPVAEDDFASSNETDYGSDVSKVYQVDANGLRVHLANYASKKNGGGVLALTESFALHVDVIYKSPGDVRFTTPDRVVCVEINSLRARSYLTHVGELHFLLSSLRSTPKQRKRARARLQAGTKGSSVPTVSKPSRPKLASVHFVAASIGLSVHARPGSGEALARALLADVEAVVEKHDGKYIVKSIVRECTAECAGGHVGNRLFCELLAPLPHTVVHQSRVSVRVDRLGMSPGPAAADSEREHMLMLRYERTDTTPNRVHTPTRTRSASRTSFSRDRDFDDHPVDFGSGGSGAEEPAGRVDFALQHRHQQQHARQFGPGAGGVPKKSNHDARVRVTGGKVILVNDVVKQARGIVKYVVSGGRKGRDRVAQWVDVAGTTVSVSPPPPASSSNSSGSSGSGAVVSARKRSPSLADKAGNTAVDVRLRMCHVSVLPHVPTTVEMVTPPAVMRNVSVQWPAGAVVAVEAERSTEVSILKQAMKQAKDDLADAHAQRRHVEALKDKEIEDIEQQLIEAKMAAAESAMRAAQVEMERHDANAKLAQVIAMQKQNAARGGAGSGAEAALVRELKQLREERKYLRERLSFYEKQMLMGNDDF